MILAGILTGPVLAAWLIAVAVGASMFTLGAAWSTCLDIGGRHAGVVSAAMNTSGQIGSILSPLMVTFLLGQLGDWNAPLFRPFDVLDLRQLARRHRPVALDRRQRRGQRGGEVCPRLLPQSPRRARDRKSQPRRERREIGVAQGGYHH